MQHNKKRRVVITGLGVVAPNGIGKEAFWQATSMGVSSIRPLGADIRHTRLPLHVAGSMPDFQAERYIERKLINRTDRSTHLALAAFQEALNDSRLNLEQENPQRLGVVIANMAGGLNFVEKQIEAIHTRGPRALSAYTAIAWLQVANVGQTTIRYGIQGYCKTPVNDTVSGLNGLGMAYRAIQRGAAEVIFAGGCEGLINITGISIVGKQGSCFTGDDLAGYRPFDRRAAGFILAEGAGICVLEEYEHALQRGATIYGEVVGYGQTNDAHGIGAPASDGTHYARALCLAMHEAGLETDDLAYISLDGRALPESDQGEAHALQLVFASDLAQLPASVPRNAFGHSHGAAGALDAITALLALQSGIIPPTMHCEELDPRYGLNLVREKAQPIRRTPTGQPAQAVLLGGRGLGGANVTLALRTVSA